MRKCRAGPIIIYLREQLKQKDEEIRRLKEQIHSNNNININSNININNTVNNIFPFGKEPMVNHTDATRLLHKPSTSVSKYVELKHFRKPETANVRISNLRGNTIQVVEQDQTGRRKWVTRDKKATISEITETNLDELVDIHKAGSVSRWNLWYEKNKLNEDNFDQTPEYKNIMKAVELTIINSRQLFEGSPMKKMKVLDFEEES